MYAVQDLLLLCWPPRPSNEPVSSQCINSSHSRFPLLSLLANASAQAMGAHCSLFGAVLLRSLPH